MINNDRGTAAVELALAMPLLFVLVLGLVQLLMIVNTKTVLDHAAYEAVRTQAVGIDAAVARKRFRRILATVPIGAGFLEGRPELGLRRQGDFIVAEASGKIILLPFLRQLATVVNGSGAVLVTAKATAKAEPYLGY